MNICFVVNDIYVNNMLVLITSIFSNTVGSHNFYILTNGLTIKNREIINEFVNKNNSVATIIDVDDKCLDGVPLKRKDFNKTPYYKLLIPEVLPKNVDRVLYMDVDMIVKNDLQDLYSVDLEDRLFAAVPDPLVNVRDPEYLKKLNFNDSADKYFNSGLILFSLKQFRRVYSIEEALIYIEKNGSTFKFHDQEVLNGMYGKQYKQLDEKYNYLTIFRGFKDLFVYLICGKSYLKNIVVLHYANATKPWKRNYIGKFEKEFWRYAELSPIYNEIHDNRKNSCKEQFIFLLSVIKRKMNI